jgi:hypothetical protein
LPRFSEKARLQECPQIAVDIIEHVDNRPAHLRWLDGLCLGFDRYAQALHYLRCLIVARVQASQIDLAAVPGAPSSLGRHRLDLTCANAMKVQDVDVAVEDSF